MSADKASIETQRLSLRLTRPEDLQELKMLFENPLVSTPAIGSSRPRETTDPYQFLGDHMIGIECSFSAYTIIDREINRLVGGTTFDFEDGSISYWIGQPYWGRGYAPEALLGLSNTLKAEFGMDSIRAITLRENFASRRVLEKAGFHVQKMFYSSSGQTKAALLLYHMHL